MELHILFGQRKESYPGEYGPEVLVCWDEFCIDENPEGFHEAVEKARKEYESSFTSMRVVVVKVDGSKIKQLLNETPAVNGEIQP